MSKQIAAAEDRGHQLAEDLNNSLNDEFEETALYRAAVEEALGFLESIIAGLNEDARRNT